MKDRKLDTSLSANNAVAFKRIKYDRHLNECADCQPSLCHKAQTLWRDVCVTALRTQGRPPVPGGPDACNTRGEA